MDYTRNLARRFSQEPDVVDRKIRQMRSNMPEAPTVETLKPGVYGLDVLPALVTERTSIHISASFDEFLENYETVPQIYFHESLSMEDIQKVRRDCQLLDVSADALVISATGEESTTMAALADCYRNGVTNISVLVPGSDIVSINKKNSQTIILRRNSRMRNGYSSMPMSLSITSSLIAISR